MLAAHPLARSSIPASGVRTAARNLPEVGDASGFASSTHLAAHTAIAPVTGRSATSVKGEHPAPTGAANSNARSSSPPAQPLSDPTFVRHAPRQDPLPAPRDHSRPCCGLATT
uniref:transposase n=1 Tax=Actinokineospora iranica TaxID=1271860 RepID=UPI003899527D